MSDTAPTGFVTMTAGDIRKAAEAVIKEHEVQIIAWRADFEVKLIAWRARGGLPMLWLWMFPKDITKLKARFSNFTREDQPDIGAPPCPLDPYAHREWLKRVNGLPDDMQVSVSIDDAAILMPGVPK